jgi:hypothetical protein
MQVNSRLLEDFHGDVLRIDAVPVEDGGTHG